MWMGFAETRCRLDAEVLDLVPEDAEGLQKKRSTYQWDKVRKGGRGWWRGWGGGGVGGVNSVADAGGGGGWGVGVGVQKSKKYVKLNAGEKMGANGKVIGYKGLR